MTWQLDTKGRPIIPVDDKGRASRPVRVPVAPSVARGFVEIERTGDVYLSPGRTLRVSAQESPNGFASVNVRGWITEEAYPILTSAERTGSIGKGKGRKRPRIDRDAFRTKHGAEGCPDMWQGIKNLTPREAYELAEALVQAAMVVESRQETESEGMVG